MSADKVMTFVMSAGDPRLVGWWFLISRAGCEELVKSGMNIFGHRSK